MISSFSIVHVSILAVCLQDRESGRPRGFAFVTMKLGAQEAINALNETDFNVSRRAAPTGVRRCRCCFGQQLCLPERPDMSSASARANDTDLMGCWIDEPGESG
jgi:hypothetical protein